MRTRTHKVNRGLAVAAGLTLVGLGAAALPGVAQAKVDGNPPGNNGSVKISPPAQNDGIPQNNPHVSCPFDIEWYGFDQGPDIVSTVTFTMQAPTGDVVVSGTEPSQVPVGGGPVGGTGSDLDGRATYTLAFDGAPDPQQGYHVKVTVHTPGSQGADTKQKVFWVTPCDDSGPGGEGGGPGGE